MSIILSNLTMSSVSASTSGATPPPPAGDTYWSSVTLLTGTTGTNRQNNTVFLDGSSNARTVFTSGAVTQGTFSPFAVATGSSYSPATNGGSGYFVNGNVYIVNGPYAVANDFTAECWFYRTDTGGGGRQYIFGEQGFGCYFGIDSNGAVFGSIGYALFSGGAQVVTIGAWHHLVMVRSGSNVAAFVDGIRVATATANGTFWYQFVGGLGSGYFTYNAYGYLSDCRIVNSAVYNPLNSTITVPTAPLTAISGTQLLMNFTNAGIYDAAVKNDMFTVADTQVSTEQAKFGTTSIKFDGTRDTLYAAQPSSNFAFGTGDFTIEGWVYTAATTPTAGGVFQQGATLFPAGTTNSIAFGTVTAGQVWQIYAGNASSNSAATWTTGTWYNFAVVRSSGTTKLYINGVSVISVADTVNYTGTYMGMGAIYGASPYNLNGYIQDFRVTKAVARYTANFAAPTEPFPTN